MSNQGKLFGGLVLLIVVLIGGLLTYQFLKYKHVGLDGRQTAHPHVSMKNEGFCSERHLIM